MIFTKLDFNDLTTLPPASAYAGSSKHRDVDLQFYVDHDKALDDVGTGNKDDFTHCYYADVPDRKAAEDALLALGFEHNIQKLSNVPDNGPGSVYVLTQGPRFARHSVYTQTIAKRLHS